jgi:hypothetical protein
VTTKTGVVATSLAEENPRSVLSQNLQQFQHQWSGFFSFKPSEVLVERVTPLLPVEVVHQEQTGSVAGSFADDWYNHIHLLPGRLNLGNLLSSQTRPVEVFNAWEEDKILNTIETKNADGIAIKGLESQSDPVLPKTYGPLESQTYEFSISTNGPPVIDALYQFNFSSEQPTLVVIGRRVVVFPFAPSWRAPIIEQLAWKTSILTAHNGSEQRIQLRQQPRRQLEYELFAELSEASLLEAMLWGWQARVYALPLWTEPHRLNQFLPSNSSVIPVPTANKDFFVGGLAVLIQDPFTVEAVEVAQVNEHSITLHRPTAFSWPIGSFVYPARLARLPKKQSLSRLTAGVAKANVRFEMAELSLLDAKEYPTQYRDYAVLDKRPNWSNPIDAEYARKLTRLDYQVGLTTLDTHSATPAIVQNMTFLLENAADILSFRQWLYARAGQQHPVWVPTWSTDLEVIEPVTTDSPNLTIRTIGYDLYYRAQFGRNDVMVLLNDDTVFYRHIVGSVQSETARELITLDKPLGRTIHPKEIKLVSFMGLCRLDSDQVEIVWQSSEVAIVSLNFRLTPPPPTPLDEAN